VDRVLLVALGGGIGSVLRYLTSGVAARWLGLDFPYGTLIVNVAGSFLIGLVQALAEEAAVLPEPARLFLSAGVMGGFTTYSAFSYETVRLVELDAFGRAVANVVITTVVCLGVCVLGLAAGRYFVSLRG
jgi:CrcB protein